jgi:LysR family glycine cleavage system transcriptional activator
MDPTRLPSLTALRAFDAVARGGGFSAAARALNVTHAAVAQQVRALERDLGVTLLYRQGRGLALTDEGETLATALKESFAQIAAAVAQITGPAQSRPLRVTMTPSFASQWLMPRLRGFWAAHPDVPLTLHPDKRLVDLHREGMDLAIRFGDGHWPGLTVDLLTPAAYAVVAAPALLNGRTHLTRDDMRGMPWVIEDDWPEQTLWLRRFGIDPDGLTGLRVPTEELALEAARQGFGLHLELPALIEDDLARGRLVKVHQGDAEGLGYFLVTRPGPVKPALRLFTRWLRSVA